MMTANPTASGDLPPFESAAARHHRRSREEVEALAKNFAATPVEEVPPPIRPRTRLALAAGGCVVLLALLTILVWPQGEEAVRPAADTRRAATEAEQWRQRYEAERQRKRQELKAGSDYMARMAAADSALLKDMTVQAQALAERAAAPQPAASVPDREPTPRDAPAKAAPAASKASSGASPAPATTVASAEPAPAKAASAEAAPQVVARAAPAASCSIHVSELSSSGKLTYADVAALKGARTDSRGHVLTPPVKAAGGRTVVFEVMPDGCVRLNRR